MSWRDYYRLLERYDGDLKRATREEVRQAAERNPNTPREARALAERIWQEEHQHIQTRGQSRVSSVAGTRRPSNLIAYRPNGYIFLHRARRDVVGPNLLSKDRYMELCQQSSRSTSYCRIIYVIGRDRIWQKASRRNWRLWWPWRFW